MAKAKEQYDATKGLVIDVAEGQCLCGCGADISKGRRFRQGHDARLRGMLGRAFTAKVPVTVNGKRSTAASQLKAHSFPEPPAPKAKAEKKAEPKAKSTKKSAKPKQPKVEAETPEPEAEAGDEAVA